LGLEVDDALFVVGDKVSYLDLVVALYLLGDIIQSLIPVLVVLGIGFG
jgi:hypothetical protein